MRCTKTQIWLQGYVDGELSPRRVKRLRHHLDRCAECRRELDRLSELKTLLSENRSESALDESPEFFWSQVQSRIRGETQPRLTHRMTFDLGWPRVFAWAGACVAMGAIAAFVWLQTFPKPVESVVVASVRPSLPVVDQIVTRGPDLYAQAYQSQQSKATIIWTEGMPVISLEL